MRESLSAVTILIAIFLIPVGVLHVYLSAHDPDTNCQDGPSSEFPQIDAELCGPPKVWPGDKSVPTPPPLHRLRYFNMPLVCAIRRGEQRGLTGCGEGREYGCVSGRRVGGA